MNPFETLSPASDLRAEAESGHLLAAALLPRAAPSPPLLGRSERRADRKFASRSTTCSLQLDLSPQDELKPGLLSVSSLLYPARSAPSPPPVFPLALAELISLAPAPAHPACSHRWGSARQRWRFSFTPSRREGAQVPPDSRRHPAAGPSFGASNGANGPIVPPGPAPNDRPDRGRLINSPPAVYSARERPPDANDGGGGRNRLRMRPGGSVAEVSERTFEGPSTWPIRSV